MTAIAPLSRLVPRAIPFRWWQAGKVAPLDCTGFTCVVIETTLPFAPVIEAVNAATGQFRFAAPSPTDLAKLKRGRRYGVQVLLRNGSGIGVEDFGLILEAV